MFEQKNIQGVSKVPSSSTSPQRDIVVMPSEFFVKTVTSSRPLLLVLGGMLLFAIGGVSIVLVLNMTSPVPPPETAPLPSAEVPVIPEPQDTPLVPPIVEEPLLPEPEIVPVSPLGAEDPDSDGLTNSEEEIVKTDSKNPDTDGDSYNDGDEVKNFFDPTKSSGALLKDSGSIHLFTESSLQWSLWVPSLWVITQGDGSGGARIATALPDTFDITHEENPQRVPLDAWVSAAQGGSTTPSLARPNFVQQNLGGLATIRSGATVLWTSDSLGVYITKPGTDVVYRIAYKKGASEKIYFPAIFRMMVDSMILP